MKTNRKKKGEKGYLAYQKKAVVLRTALLFALSLAVFGIGLVSTGHKENLLTIVAVLGCLPASRSAVNMVMLLRYHGISEEDAAQIALHTKNLDSLYDLVFTSYEKNYEIHHMAYRADCLIGYTKNADCDAQKCAGHLRGLCAQNRLQKVDIKIFKDLSKYINRLEQLQSMQEDAVSKEQDTEGSRAERLFALLRAVSL